MSTPQFPVPGEDRPIGPPPVPAPAPPAAPPGAYGVPVGGYQVPADGYPGGGYQVPAPTRTAPRTTGAVALILALVATIVIPIVAAVLAFQIGALLPNTRITVDSSFSDDLSMLTPARTQVLWAEIAFWSGTALGITAIVLGIIATAKRRGRGLGITGIVLAALGPIAYFVALSVFLTVGAVASATTGT